MKFLSEKYLPLISSILTLVVYITTMSRGIMPIDAGELAASQYYLGISHPSGYPLFNLIGFLWSKIPIGSVIFRLNLLCAIWVALANFFLIKTAFLVIKNSTKKLIPQNPTPNKKGANDKKTIEEPSATPPALALIASLSGVLLIAFCKTWWIQSAGVEVYSLHIALLAAFFFVFIKTIYKEKQVIKDWILPGVLLGLCLSNHLTSSLILPGVLILFLWKTKWNLNMVKNGAVFTLAAIVVAGIFYLFMMTNAGNSPKVNYGNPSNFEYLNRHVQGWQFQSFMNKKENSDTLEVFLHNFKMQSGYIGWILVVFGMIGMLIKNYKLATFWLIHFIATLIYASRFDIHDIENYFLLAYLANAVFIGFGIYWLLSLLNKKNQLEKNKIIYVLLLLPILPLYINYSKSDQSKLSYVDDYTKAALNSVDKNAIILSREWDVFVSPAYYYHLVEHQRPDITILDKELLRRSWYHNQVKAWDKDLAVRIEKQAEEFNEEVIKFERKQKYDPAILQPKFETYITAILSQYKNRPVYISSAILEADLSHGIDVKLPPNTALVPETYFYRVIPFDTVNYHALPVPAEFNVEFTDLKKDKFQQQIFDLSMSVLSARVEYERGFNRKDEARKLVQLMQSIDSRVTMPPGL